MTVESSQCAELLTELQGSVGDLSEAPDVVLVVDSDQGVRNALRGIIGRLLPNHLVKEADSCSAAVARMTGDLALRVALVLSLEDDPSKTFLLARNEDNHLRGAPEAEYIDLSRVPIISAPGVWSGKSALVQKLFADGQIDGVIQKPFGLHDAREAILSSVQNRLGLFQEVEGVARHEELEEFIGYCVDFVPSWASRASQVSFLPDPDQEVAKFSSEYDARVVVESLVTLQTHIDELSSFGSDISEDDLSRLSHAIRNTISYFYGSLQALLEAKEKLSPDDVLLIDVIYKEVSVLLNWLTYVMRAYKKDALCTWSSLRAKKHGLSESHKLVLPEGCSVCVIDDDAAIRTACERMINYVGGVAHEAWDGDSLEALYGDAGASGIQVFLLDDDLGESGRGHELIDHIRERWPEALIIGHTGHSVSINADSETPYKAAGVEVAGKNDWNAVSGIIRRKLVQEEPEMAEA